jgi:hypothetical protein
MNAYVYQATLLCENCALERMSEQEFARMLYGSNPWPKYWTKPWTDGDSYPQGPYPNGGGEADSPQHCDACGVFLENPLTGDGSRYVNEHLIEHARDGSGNRDVLTTWAKYYNAQVYEPGEVTHEDLEFEYSLEDDNWGSVMAWWFTIAGELYTRNETLPAEWKYEPGIRPVDPDDHKAPLVAGAPTAILFEFMKTIEPDASRLKAEGKDY